MDLPSIVLGRPTTRASVTGAAGLSSREMIQLTFDLPRRTALGRSDFLVSDSNAKAVGWLDRWPDWPPGALALHGPPSCGKTHLVHLWCERASAVVVTGATLDEDEVVRLVAEGRHRIAVDDAEHASERALLHLHNTCLEHRGGILIAARQPPASWTIVLDDLGSRLRAALTVEIGPPDEALLGALLVKHFADHQVRVAPEVVAYLLKHMERSFAAAADITARLDLASLRDRRAITVPLARELLAESGNHA
jgi:chromosomal replication initiation ATPase DnaA